MSPTPRQRVAALVVLFAASLAPACGGSGAAKETPPRPTPSRPAGVAARGRIEPKDGVLHVNGPSDIVSVVATLDVDQGDRVTAGQRIAVMDTFTPRQARVAQLRARIAANEASAAALAAELARAEAEERRAKGLHDGGILSPSDRELTATRLDVARARLEEAKSVTASARAELASAEVDRDLAIVRAPVDGTVIKVEARPGERVGPSGIVTLGRTGAMYAFAQVYETDVTKVRVGQRAVVRSPAFAKELTGTVERVGLKVGRLDALGTDPGARSDARVVEVEVRLDDAAAAAGLTDLEVEVLIAAGS